MQMDIGRIGIWSMGLEARPLSVAQEAAAELDELGSALSGFQRQWARKP
jgi:hypothetical protein